jgi:hypothetical protein
MAVATRPGHDVTHLFLSHLPHDGLIRALYLTGSPDIVATPQDIAANPGCLLIDQSPVNTALDETADYLDFENGAATLADLAPWTVAAWAAWHAVKRPGQRTPAIYASRSNITEIVNRLIADGVKDNVGLVVADWNNNEVAAALEVSNASGPFPIVGRQYQNAGLWDNDVFSVPWLANVSRRVVAPVYGELTTGGPTKYFGREVVSIDGGLSWK